MSPTIARRALISATTPVLFACGNGIVDLDSRCQPAGEWSTSGCAVVAGRVIGFAARDDGDKLIIQADLPPYDGDINGIAVWKGGRGYSITVKRRTDVQWPDTVSAILRWSFVRQNQVMLQDSTTVTLHFSPEWSTPLPTAYDIASPQ